MNLLIASFLDETGAEHVIQTHATNPLLRPDTIDRAAERYFTDDDLTSVFAVTRYQARFFTERLEAVNHDPTELLPTQQLPPLFMENSNFYIFSSRGFAVHGRRITERTSMYEIDPVEAIDIDEERDFALAESLLRVGAGAPTVDAANGEERP